MIKITLRQSSFFRFATFIIVIFLTKQQQVGLALCGILFFYRMVNAKFDFKGTCILISTVFLAFLNSYSAFLDQHDTFYILNEFRVFFFLLALLIMQQCEPMIEGSTSLIIPIVVIGAVGLSRGFDGLIMPIYCGVLAFIFYPKVFQMMNGLFALILGSASASLAVLAASQLARFIKLPFFRKILLGSTICFIIGGLVAYQVLVRGRLLEWESIDRVVLISEGLRIYFNYGYFKILFGFGPGLDFSVMLSESQAPVLLWVKNSVGLNGFYSYLFHSDPIRLLLNYGLVITLSIYWLLYRYLSRDLFVLISVAGIFNPIILTPTLLIALLIFGGQSQNKLKGFIR